MAESTTIFGSKYSPRFSLNKHLDSSQTIRFSVSRAYRAPVTYEESADTRITDSDTLNDVEVRAINELKPEKITSIDIGYIFQSPKYPYAVDLRIFREEVRDIVTPFVWVSPLVGVTDDYDPAGTEPPTLLMFANHDRADVQGFETQLTYTPSKVSRLQAVYNYIDIKSTQKSHDDLLDQFDYEYNDYLYDLSAPQHSASLMAYYMPQDRLQLTVSYHWLDKMKWNGGVGDNLNNITYRSMVPRHDRIDLRLGMPFTKSGMSGEVTVHIRNLLGDDHYDYQKHNKSQRLTYIAVSLNFE
jgi:iron complex outermembrane receptor protein